MRRLLVVAGEEELLLPRSREAVSDGREVVITGVGGVNVINCLRELGEDCDVLNVGYVGSRFYPKGYEVEIGECRAYHPNCTFDEPVFSLGDGALCLTSGDFVTDGYIPDGSVVDMELAYIAAFGFKVLRAVKYVSDGLDYAEYVESSGNVK